MESPFFPDNFFLCMCMVGPIKVRIVAYVTAGVTSETEQALPPLTSVPAVIIM